MSAAIVWFRRDLRLHDNRAMTEACLRSSVIPLYIHDPESEAPWQPGAASDWWLHQSLTRLDGALNERGSRLIVRSGPAREVLATLVRETGAKAIHWNRLYEPTTIPRDVAIKEWATAEGLEARSHSGYLLFEPHIVRNKQGDPFKVFTPFWKHLLTLDEPPEPLPVPKMKAPDTWPGSEPVASLGLLPRIPWDTGFYKAWEPGEVGARERLTHFLGGIAGQYGENRDRPDLDGTSRLSPHLHFGEVSPADAWHQTRLSCQSMTPAERASAHAFLREVGWREFSAHLLFHFSHTATRPLRPEFERFPWQDNARLLKAWQRGQTGYPIVDAGMRQLWATGWMHNRVRMIVASFLVKHLLVSWQRGAEWFWDTLVDADLASNTMGWQWTAGCGADAAPFFRIFNPMTQGEKFDPSGSYVRQWVPELAGLPLKYLNAPWTAIPSVLTAAGVELGVSYPKPIVDHQEAREEALGAWQNLRSEPGAAKGPDLFEQ